MKPINLIRKQLQLLRLPVASLVILWASTLPAGAGENNVDVEQAAEKWTLVPMFSFSSLSGRPSWEEYDTQLFYKINPSLIVGGEIDVRHRPPSGTDTLYSAMVSYYPWKPLEVHGKITVTPDAEFSPDQIYEVGFEVQAVSRVSLILDYQHYNYSDGSIDQIKPGITYWFTDETFLTLRYARGRAFGDTDYDGFGGKFNLGLPGKRRLIFGYWHGTDPERDIESPDTIAITGDTYSLYFQQPLKRNIDLIVGIEYETLEDSYNRTTGTIGLAIKF